MNYLDLTTIGPDDNLNPPEPQERIEPSAEERAEDFWNERGMNEMLFKRFPDKVREPKNAKEFLFGL